MTKPLNYGPIQFGFGRLVLQQFIQYYSWKNIIALNVILRKAPVRPKFDPYEGLCMPGTAERISVVGTSLQVE